MVFMTDVTRILSQIDHGDSNAADQLLTLVYEELRKLAAATMARERPGQTLQATALVHEAYLRLVDPKYGQKWNSRGHFFSAAAEAMRRILVDHAREKHSLRRGGDRKRHALSSLEIEQFAPDVDLLAINEAVTKLEQQQPLAAEILKMRFFCGMTIEETAGSLGISHATVERHWAYARARLHAELAADE
jgi:RNA polymerase sigma factor (TIGR02999 family)